MNKLFKLMARILYQILVFCFFPIAILGFIWFVSKIWWLIGFEYAMRLTSHMHTQERISP